MLSEHEFLEKCRIMNLNSRDKEFNQADFSKKCLVIYTNEIVPRANKCRMKPSDFIPEELAGLCAKLEYYNACTRREIRQFLDVIVEIKSQLS